MASSAQSEEGLVLEDKQVAAGEVGGGDQKVKPRGICQPMTAP